MKNDSIISELLKENKKTSIYSIAEEREAFLQLKNGCLEKREEIMFHNLGLVITIAKKYNAKNMDFDDLIQIGMEGLLKAIDNFDLDFKTRFSSFAFPYIKGEISRQIASDSPFEPNFYNKVLKVKKTITNYEATYNTKPSVLKLSELTKIPEKEIEFILIKMEEHNYLSLDVPITDEENTSLEALVPSKGKNPEDEVVDSMYANYILEIIDRVLSPRDKEIICYFCGLNGYPKLNNVQIGKILGFDRFQIDKIIKRDLTKLRTIIQKENEPRAKVLK